MHPGPPRLCNINVAPATGFALHSGVLANAEAFRWVLTDLQCHREVRVRTAGVGRVRAAVGVGRVGGAEAQQTSQVSSCSTLQYPGHTPDQQQHQERMSA